MGGLVFIGATLIAYVAGHLVLKTLPAEQIVPPGPTMTGLVLLGLMVCCGAIGFADDYLKVSGATALGSPVGGRSCCRSSSAECSEPSR